jgi:hypothetical protein
MMLNGVRYWKVGRRRLCLPALCRTSSRCPLGGTRGSRKNSKRGKRSKIPHAAQRQSLASSAPKKIAGDHLVREKQGRKKSILRTGKHTSRLSFYQRLYPDLHLSGSHTANNVGWAGRNDQPVTLCSQTTLLRIGIQRNTQVTLGNSTSCVNRSPVIEPQNIGC